MRFPWNIPLNHAFTEELEQRLVDNNNGARTEYIACNLAEFGGERGEIDP